MINKSKCILSGLVYQHTNVSFNRFILLFDMISPLISCNFLYHFVKEIEQAMIERLYKPLPGKILIGTSACRLDSLSPSSELCSQQHVFSVAI
jgi:hypothetical protein